MKYSKEVGIGGLGSLEEVSIGRGGVLKEDRVKVFGLDTTGERQNITSGKVQDVDYDHMQELFWQGKHLAVEIILLLMVVLVWRGFSRLISG